MISYFWIPSSEIKKGSRLIIRPGQDAIFMYNGRIEGIFREEGNFDVFFRYYSIFIYTEKFYIWI